MRIGYVLAILIATTLVGAACSNSPKVSPAPRLEAAYQTMSIDAFAAALDQPDAYTVVNVHVPYEGEVPNTDLQIPYNDIDALTAALPNRNTPIILYCRSGRMSQEASEVLLGLGYTNISDVPGGMNAWTASGRELIYTDKTQ